MFKNKLKKHFRQNSGHIKSYSRQESPEFKNYLQLISDIEGSHNVFIVLDARIPQGCRFLNLEDIIEKEMNAKITFILNKIDLIPREMAIGWMSYFKQAHDVVALSSTDNIDPLLEYISQNNIKDAVFTGMGGVGKKTIKEKIKDIQISITQPWTFLIKTHEQTIINPEASSKQQVITQFKNLVTFLDLCPVQSLMEVFSLSAVSSSINVISNISSIISAEGDQDSVIMGIALLQLIHSSDIIFYTPPPAKFFDEDLINNLSPIQKETIKKCKLLDQYETPPLTYISYTVTNEMLMSVKKSLLQKFNKRNK